MSDDDYQLKPDDRVIPAVPGFQWISFWIEDDREDPQRTRDPNEFDIKANLWRETIVAWRLNADWYPEAILPGRSQVEQTGKGSSGAYISAILDPAGGVIMQEDCVYRNLDEWIARVREEWRTHRQQFPPPRGSRPRLIK